jgi:hypothetical protein
MLGHATSIHHPGIQQTTNANEVIKSMMGSTGGKKRVLCGYGIDIDAVAGWLGSYGGEDSTSDISRGT